MWGQPCLSDESMLQALKGASKGQWSRFACKTIDCCKLLKRFDTTQFIHFEKAVFSFSVSPKTLTFRSLGMSLKLSKSVGCLGRQRLWADDCDRSLCSACQLARFSRLLPASYRWFNRSLWIYSDCFNARFLGRNKQNENTALSCRFKGISSIKFRIYI